MKKRTWFVEDAAEGRPGYDYRTQLIIKDGDSTRTYWDGGEPEDNTFGRDWGWVFTELEKAYEAGRRDANAEREGN